MIYQIRIAGHLDGQWTDWFGGLTITLEGGDTLLTGGVVDQTALHGVLRKVRDLGLPLIAVQRVTPGEGADLERAAPEAQEAPGNRSSSQGRAPTPTQGCES
jgi:hypothetical protein